MNSAVMRATRRQLSAGLKKYLEAATAAPEPKSGWVSSIRQAIGMTAAQLARRMNVAHPSVVRLERAEKEGAVTLATLRKAANAMNCDLIYAVVPRVEGPTFGASPAADESAVLDELLRREAYRVARLEAEEVSRTMALEDQGLTEAELRHQLLDRAMELAANPKRLWDEADRFLQRPPRNTSSGRPRKR